MSLLEDSATVKCGIITIVETKKTIDTVNKTIAISAIGLFANSIKDKSSLYSVVLLVKLFE